LATPLGDPESIKEHRIISYYLLMVINSLDVSKAKAASIMFNTFKTLDSMSK
jgi:hypothetical protein